MGATSKQQKPSKITPVFLFLGLIGIIGYLGIACGGIPDSTAVPRATVTPSTHTIEYRLDTSGASGGQVDVTYNNKNGDTAQEGPVWMPWSYKFQAAPGAFLYVSGQVQSEYGNVTCQILVDGIPVKETTSSGAYVIATCSGRL